MNIRNILVLAYLFFLPFLFVEASETSNLTLPKIKVVPIKDTQADRQYELYIKLPEDYEKNKDQSYSVIYYTDAMWHVELLSSATEYLMENAILVGISWQKDIKESLEKEKGEHVSRFRDYSINPSSNPETQDKYQLGQASNHLAFIRNDVIKFIENKYRAIPDNRTYFGYSLGGLLGAYILMASPDTFKNYILGSPALSGDIGKLSKLDSKTMLEGEVLNANVFISYGSLEKKLGEHTEKFITLLRNKNDMNVALKNVVIEGSHQTAFPLTGVRSITWLSSLTRERE
jgi:predicted alpha/beta superfamily hydrolase